MTSRPVLHWWGLLALAMACGGARPGPSLPMPAFSSPEAAAVHGVYGDPTRRRPEPELALLTLSSGSAASDTSLRRELSPLFRVSDVVRSDSLYGGEQRFRYVHGEHYLVLDVRAEGPGDTLMVVSTERCPGWPCHRQVVARVRGDGNGYVAVALLRTTVE